METEPGETGPTGPADAGWDGVGIPPEGTRLSTPVQGELIKEYPGYHASTYVFADGRVIWFEGGSPSSGNGHIYERRLTPEGVDLVRSGAKLDNHPLDDLPASAWTDAEQRLYAAQTYTVCFWKMGGELDPSHLMEILPPPVNTLLQRWDLDTLSGCLEVTTEQARDREPEQSIPPTATGARAAQRAGRLDSARGSAIRARVTGRGGRF